MMRRWYLHVLAILGDGPSGYIDALVAELFGDLFIRKRVPGVFLFDHLLHPSLEDQQRRGRSGRPLDRFREEEAELVNSLWSVSVFAGHR